MHAEEVLGCDVEAGQRSPRETIGPKSSPVSTRRLQQRKLHGTATQQKPAWLQPAEVNVDASALYAYAAPVTVPTTRQTDTGQAEFRHACRPEQGMIVATSKNTSGWGR